MRSSVLLGALLIIAAFWSGCAGETDDAGPADATTTSADGAGNATTSASGGATTATSTASGTSASSSPGPSGNASSLPPTASVTANVSAGSVPLTVNFTFDASDPENGSLTWTLDADTDGTPEAEGSEMDLPGSYQHVYAAEGDFNVTFTVSDGTSSVNATLIISVAAAAADNDPCKKADPATLTFNQYYVTNPPGVFEETNGYTGLQKPGGACTKPDRKIA